MSAGAGVVPVAAGSRPAAVPGLGGSCLAVGLLWLALAGLESLRAALPWDRVATHLAVAAVGAAVVTLALSRLDSAFRWLASPAFASALLAFVLGATLTGTLVLQGLPEEALAGRYGEVGAMALRALALDNVFHALPFRGSLALLAAALVLVTARRKAWRTPGWGFLLTHAGVVLVLAGGLAGNLFGGKWKLDLREGQVSRTLRSEGGGNAALGFGLGLDRFEIERYPSAPRACVPGEIKAFRSRVTVVENGRTALSASIEVNHPLSYGGYTFYQSGFRPEDPGTSELLVVRDPGLGIAYAGLGMVASGILFLFYGRPMLRLKGWNPGWRH